VIEYVEPVETRISEPTMRRGVGGGVRYPGQGVDGYGRKIASRYMVRLLDSGTWYRVYITQISNAGSAWIMRRGKKLFIQDVRMST
jgi:hypothetical protein